MSPHLISFYVQQPTTEALLSMTVAVLVLKIPLLSPLSVCFEQEPENAPVEQTFRNLGRAVDQTLMGEEKRTVSRAVNLLPRKIDSKVGEPGGTK